MSKTLLEELPRIAAEGRREAQQVLDRLSGGVQIGLQTNELVLPARDTSGLWRGQNTNQDLYQPWYNRLIYGDNMLAFSPPESEPTGRKTSSPLNRNLPSRDRISVSVYSL